MERTLPTAIVRRAGVTASTWSEVDDPACTFAFNQQHLLVHLRIPSAGGGTTDVEIRLGEADVSAILGALAIEWPGATLALSQAAAAAAQSRHEALVAVRPALADQGWALEALERWVYDARIQEPSAAFLDEEETDLHRWQEVHSRATRIVESASPGEGVEFGIARVSEERTGE